MYFNKMNMELQIGYLMSDMFMLYKRFTNFIKVYMH